MTPTDSPERTGHETRDVSFRAIVGGAIGLGILIVFTVATMFGLLDFFANREARLSPPASPLASSYAPKQPPEPRLQAHPIRDLETLRASESRLLDGYGWVDRATGTVRIPIERAMELVVTRAGKTAVRPEGAR